MFICRIRCHSFGTNWIVGLCFTFLMSLLLSACGGGGGGSTSITSVAKTSTLANVAADNPAPTGIAVDAQGNVYVAQWRDGSAVDNRVVPTVSSAWGTISKINTNNQETTFVSGLSDPVVLTFGANGDLYFAETSGSTEIKEITSSGVSSVFVDLALLDSNFVFPSGIYFDSQSSKFYVTTQTGYLGVISSAGDLIKLLAIPHNPRLGGLVVDAAGNIYVCDYRNSKILKIDTADNVSTFAGSTQGFADGMTTNAQFKQPYDITKDAIGNFYVTDQGNNKIRKITSSGLVTTLTPVLSSGAAATFNGPSGIAIDANGSLYITEYYGRGVQKIDFVAP